MKAWSETDFEPGRDTRVRKQRQWLLWGATAATLLVWFNSPSIRTAVLHCIKSKSDLHGASLGDFSWDAINATEHLEFHDCLGYLQCAKLKLPLDYFNGTHENSSVSIAIAKLPAKVPVDDPRYGGPILINPGGPGGSGVMLAQMIAADLQTIVDPSVDDSSVTREGKYYDILGFDPRGVGLTEPAASCMPDDASAWSWILREVTEGILGSSDAALGRLWSMSHAYGASCKRHMNEIGGPDIKKYMSTASVARDMLEIVERHAEWAVEESNKLTMPKVLGSRVCTGSKPTQLRLYERGVTNLTYLGFSYGTYLGATFAAMFPDRVGRLLLDGVVNAHDYNNALGQGSLRDTERDMKSFYSFCLLAGPERCQLSNSVTSIEEMEAYVQRIVRSLYHNPIAIDTKNGPEILSYSDLKGMIFSLLYQPSPGFEYLGSLLQEIEARSGPMLEMIGLGLRIARVYSCPASEAQTFLTRYPVAQDAILCGDGEPFNDLDIQSMESYWRVLEDISPSAGSIWAMLRMRCAAWPIRPLYTFGHDENFHGITSHPILWVSGTADPVTPLHSARAMAARYPGSGLLVQDTAGHCASAQLTPCAIAAIKNYFQTGALPDPDTVCVPASSPYSLNSTDPNSPFYDPSLGQAVIMTEQSLEKEVEAAKKLQFHVHKFLNLGRGHLGHRVNDMVNVVMQFSGFDEPELLEHEL